MQQKLTFSPISFLTDVFQLTVGRHVQENHQQYLFVEAEASMPLVLYSLTCFFSWEQQQYSPFLTHVKKIFVSGQTSRFLMLGNALFKISVFS